MTNKGSSNGFEKAFMSKHQDNLSKIISSKSHSVQWTDEKKPLVSRMTSNNENSFETGSPKPIIKKRPKDA